jgi:hypothetical protein
MNVEPTKCGWIMALGALLLLVGTPAVAQKKPGGGGSTTDCASAIGFPAFIFYRSSGSSGATYVADLTGKCVRLVASGIHSYINTFSFPLLDDTGQPTNRGRIVWNAAGPAGTFNAFYALDFTVASTANGPTVTAGSPYLVKDFGPNSPHGNGACCGIELSRDGRRLYVSAPAEEDEQAGKESHRIVRIPLPNNLAQINPASPPTIVYTGPSVPFGGPGVPVTGTTWNLTVDGSAHQDEQNLYLVRRRVDTIDELVRVGLGTGSTLATWALTGPDSIATGARDFGQPRHPAAEPTNGSTRVAFQEWVGDSEGKDCDRLYFVDGVSGAITGPTVPVYADNMTWAGGKVLGNGMSSRCRSAGSIVEIDPASGATRTLVTGYHADGR